MATEDIQRRRFFASPWSVVAATGAGAFLIAYWLFGWGYPSRAAVAEFFHYSLIRDGSLTAFRDDGAEVEIDRSGTWTIADVECHRVTRRRQPGIDYYCFYTLSGSSGDAHRLVILAVHNRGWKRLGMADLGNYRLSSLSAKVQRELFERYDVDLPARPDQDQSGDI